MGQEKSENWTKNGGLRRVGFSKERRVDPQIVVGLLVDRGGYPLDITCWQGNKAETKTIIPTLEDFSKKHGLEHFIVVADAGMLSAANLKAINDTGWGFIVGARQTRTPWGVEDDFCGVKSPRNNLVIDTLTPRHANTKIPDQADNTSWDPHTDLGARTWRSIWRFTTRRYQHDMKTLKAQYDKAQNILNGKRAAKTTRFITTTKHGQSFNQTAWDKASSVAGWKGYVTNIPTHIMPPGEVIDSYHELWHVEQSFRMSKTDLRARPIFHHTREAIEAHLTIVFAALAISRHLQNATGISIKKIIQTLKPITTVTGTIAGHEIQLQPQITPQAQKILNQLKMGH